MNAAAVLVMLLAVPAAAEEKSVTLPPDNTYARLAPGPGSEQAQQQCQFCHSTDYIVMQPRGDAKQWQAVVTKMITVFGAPLSETDAKAIVEYLATAYGPPR
ncbi:MAG TPA: cytochrome c [Candidatus Methylomirabilis sp.]|nr:cytochrome c [Candidatus Methylomirabilis sp.]